VLIAQLLPWTTIPDAESSLAAYRKQNFLVQPSITCLHYIIYLYWYQIMEIIIFMFKILKFKIWCQMILRMLCFLTAYVLIVLWYTYEIVMSYSGNKERKLSVFLSCSDDGLRQCRQIYKWLMKNCFKVVFDDENSAASVNLLSWVDSQVKQASHYCYDFCVIVSAFLMCYDCRQTNVWRNSVTRRNQNDAAKCI